MSVLVTGAGGFLGGYLLSHLSYLGIQPITASSHHPTPHPHVKGTQWVCGDLTFPKFASAIVRKANPCVVYHLAGFSKVSTLLGIPDYFHGNFLTTVRLIEALAELGNPVRLFFASTVHVYGNSESISSEDSPVTPVNDYGFTKYLAEEFLRKSLAKYPWLKIVVGRLYSCFGPGQALGFVSADLCQKVARLPAKKSGTLKVGPTSTFRRFLDVRDAVRLFPQLLEAPNPERYLQVNVACAHEVQIRELITTLLRIANKKATIESNEDNSGNRLFGVKVNCEKLKTIISQAKFRPIEETLRDMYQETLQRFPVNKI